MFFHLSINGIKNTIQLHRKDPLSRYNRIIMILTMVMPVIQSKTRLIRATGVLINKYIRRPMPAIDPVIIATM